MIDLSIRSNHLYAAVQVDVEFVQSDGAKAKTVSGTGFVVVDKSKTLAALVTCRHVIDAAFDPPGRKRKGDPTWRLGSVRGRGWSKNLKRFEWVIETPTVLFHDDPVLDVAALDLDDLKVVAGSNDLGNFFDRSFLAQKEEFDGSVISAADMVVTIGYPSIDGQIPDTPFIIPGTISSDPRVLSPIPGLDAGVVAYHAFSRSGLSGSPVVAPVRGFKTSGTVLIETPGFRDSRLVGVNSGHLGTDSSDPMPLSFFCPSWAILDLLDGQTTRADPSLS